MYSYLFSSEDTMQYFKGDMLPFTVASLVLLGFLLLSGLLVYFFKKDYFNKFLYLVFGSILSYIVMTIIFMNKIYAGTWQQKSKEIWLMTLYIFIGILVFTSLALLLSYFLNSNISEKNRKIIKISVYSILVIALLTLIIGFSVSISQTAFVKYKKGVNKLKFKADTKQIILFTIFTSIILFGISLFYFLTNKDKRKIKSTKLMADAAITLSLSFALSYVKLFSMPQGGSITLASIVPIAIFAYIYGPKEGLQVGLLYAILQLIQGAYIVHPIQVLLDYIVPFTCVGLIGIFRKLDFKKLYLKGRNLNPVFNIVYGIFLYSIIRFISSFLSGAIFFGSVKSNSIMTVKELIFAPAAVTYSASYNAPYIFADMAIALLIAIPLMFSKQIQRTVNERIYINNEFIEKQK